MQIFFDWELDESLKQPKNPNNFVIIEIKKFLHSMYDGLEDKIDAAQKENEIALVAVINHEDTIELRYHNIPPELIDKFKACITQDDMDYIYESIYRKLF